MRYISGSWGAASTRVALLTFSMIGVVTNGGVGQRPDIRRSLGLDSAAFDILKDHVNGRRFLRVRVGLTDWRFAGPVLDATRFTYVGLGASPNQDSLSIGDADEIWIQGNAMVLGAMWGALTVGAASVIIGVAMMAPCPDGPDPAFCGASMANTAALVSVGVALGAVVGGVIGATQSRWKTVYERSGIVPSLRACGFTAPARLCVGTALTF